ncbi:DcrB-related protein [Polyangium aurulentum]|uniref:DcrB-related protein n=1 Tax=Polyangium aurulentum TaxID=2567896 RepID=UPI0010AECB3A|nr:DcrB-related protein [Polyangium aurulentum]UQA56212.1 DUF1795 domain-containing protein [Polyangium aurulentum]
MSVYYMNEAAFELPDVKVVDSTMTLLEFPSPSGRKIQINVQRFPLDPGKSLREIVTSQVGQATRSLRAYSVLFERDREIAGVPAIETAARWRSGDDMIYTRQAHLAFDGTWLVLAGNAPLEERETCDGYLDGVLGTLRIRD